ncbi:hypothetical protein [Micromonospora tulbaghiae]
MTGVRRDGLDLTPTLARSFHDDGIGAAATATVALTGVRLHDGEVVLRSVAATPGGGAFVLLVVALAARPTAAPSPPAA